MRRWKLLRAGAEVSARDPRVVISLPGDGGDASKIEGKAQTHDRATVDGEGIEGKLYGTWTAIKADPTGKRITCICSCGAARLIAVDALESRASLGCGCVATPKLQVAAERVRRLPDWRSKR